VRERVGTISRRTSADWATTGAKSQIAVNDGPTRLWRGDTWQQHVRRIAYRILLGHELYKTVVPNLCVLRAILSCVRMSFSPFQNRLIQNMHSELEAKDVLPNINRTQATERSKNAVFCLW